MEACKDDSEDCVVLKDGHDAQKDDEGKDCEGSVSIGINVRVPRLVDF